MIVYRKIGQSRLYTTYTNSGQGIGKPDEISYLEAFAREREIIEESAPFLKDCCGAYFGIEAKAAALAFNFTEMKS